MRADGTPIKLESISSVAVSSRAPALSGSALEKLWKTVALMALGVACYFFCSAFLLQSVRVVGSSMSPTLSDSDSYLLNRWVYHFRSPGFPDIVVLRDPADNGFSVKRVVAGPGDKVELSGGRVLVNGSILAEPYLQGSPKTFPMEEQSAFICREQQYFLLGDNRNNSVDSRTYGPVPRANILGMVIK